MSAASASWRVGSNRTLCVGLRGRITEAPELFARREAASLSREAGRSGREAIAARVATPVPFTRLRFETRAQIVPAACDSSLSSTGLMYISLNSDGIHTDI